MTTKKAQPAKTSAKPANATNKAPGKPTKQTAAKPALKLAGHGIPSGYGYPGMGKGGDHTITRDCTLAAAVVSGMLNISPKSGLVSKPKKSGSYSLFRAITAGKVSRVWTADLFESGAAVVKASGAMKGEAVGGYNATAERVHAIAALIRKGGKQTLKGKNGPVELTYTKPIKA